MYARNFLYCMQSTTTEQATKLRKKLEIANSILQNLAKKRLFYQLKQKKDSIIHNCALLISAFCFFSTLPLEL